MPRCALLLSLLLGCLVAGCSDHDRDPIITHRAEQSATGVTVFFPLWLWEDEAAVQEVLEQVDDEGVWPEITVTVRGEAPGGRYLSPYSPVEDGRIAGQTDMYTWIHCCYRWLPGQLPLPALGHEMDHVRTKDPLYGH